MTIEVINMICSAMLTLMGGTASAIWFYSSKKREAAASASKAEAEAISKYADEWKELYEQRDKRVGELNAKVDELYKEIGEMRQRLWALSDKYATMQAEKAEAVFYKCIRRGCTDRVPPHEIDQEGREISDQVSKVSK